MILKSGTSASGWVDNKVSLPESVADHMYRMSMMGFLITDEDVNKDRLIKICLVHDLAESIVGDITPHQNVSKAEKRQLEEEALRNIVSQIGNADISKELWELWMEYEEGISKEAQVAKELDKLEMIIQAEEYETGQGISLEDFFVSTRDSFRHPEVISWAQELRKQRETRKREGQIRDSQTLSLSVCEDPSANRKDVI
mmetsp:Transcript_33136/g.33745  ORF Transcript_33136/g.33745 Transcript_33136/m.33745 type:complete len:199 (-) Transcript_33136:439-1035(-)|eukprot:CAMPEP_0182430120 /NCGR_PEP_ID=MMETSP1167-20130531/37107_1 /TAXON_ID=2988 /ORGANISM="Mallomonas Sp, Strain CCMP3275" /LENGTH=198 /DNA_ID=CAMNT_0024614811 /DNA_START=129 /DNA_END=725 /DNA_ORIENTATION=+